MITVVLSVWMLNPLTQHYEFVDKGHYPTPIECAVVARSLDLKVWSCVYARI